MDCPPFPEPLRYVWKAFWRLRRRVPSTDCGPGPITWSDLESYCWVTGDRLASWEIILIETLDDLYLTASAAAIRQASNPESVPVSEGMDILTMDRPKRGRTSRAQALGSTTR